MILDLGDYTQRPPLTNLDIRSGWHNLCCMAPLFVEVSLVMAVAPMVVPLQKGRLHKTVVVGLFIL